MAMTEASLLSRFKTAFGVAGTDEGVGIQDDVLGKLAGAIIAEIQANGVVSVTTTGSCVVASGSSAGTYPVSSTGTGSIS